MSNGQVNNTLESCRRNGKDRRRKPTPVVSKHIFRGERRHHRRLGNQKEVGIFVDRPQKEVILIISAIGLLCVLDAILTLYHVGNGAVEMNPIMRYYLTIGEGYFLFFKALITIPGLIILLFHHDFYYIKKVVTCIGSVYGFVVIYHLFLFVLIA